MKQKVIADNSIEKITIKWDDTRFALVHEDRLKRSTHTTVLSPREMLELIKFAGKELTNNE